MDESAAGPLQGGRCPPGSLSTLVLFALRQQRAPRPPLASIVVIVLSWVDMRSVRLCISLVLQS